MAKYNLGNALIKPGESKEFEVSILHSGAIQNLVFVEFEQVNFEAKGLPNIKTDSGILAQEIELVEIFIRNEEKKVTQKIAYNAKPSPFRMKNKIKFEEGQSVTFKFHNPSKKAKHIFSTFTIQ